jgi:phosphohistidine phosphatase
VKHYTSHMPRELLLLRHGKSDWSAGTDDMHRPLTQRGKRAARRIGVWLAQQEMLPDCILTSPAQRALATARKACKAMGKNKECIRLDDRVYEAGVNELLAALGECPDTASRVMLVGHNPGLEALLVWLASDHVAVPEDGKLLPTAALARLAVSADWRSLSRGSARLEFIIRPSALPK